MKRLAPKALALALALALVIGLAGCATATRPREAGSASDREAVLAVVRSFNDGWNAHDADALASRYAPDAEFVNVIGMWWRGRPEIVEQHRALHATRMRATRLENLEETVRFVRDDVAVVHVRWKLTGDTGAEGWGETAERTGILSHVLVRRDGRWEIVSSQNTDIVPIPNTPG